MHADLDASLQLYAADVDALLRRLEAEHVVERLWQGDASLWHPSANTQRRIAKRLGWLELPRPIDELAGRRLPLLDDAPLTIVAPDFAGSIFRLWSAGDSAISRHVLLDSVDPRAIPEQRPHNTICLSTGDRDLLELKALQAVQGDESVASTHVEPRLTDRWASLSQLGWSAARLSGYHLGPLVAAAVEMRRACRRADDPGANPGLMLGVLLGVMAQRGRDKLTLLAAARWEPLAEWIAAFVGGSLSKHRRGFVLIADEPFGPASRYGSDRCFLVLDGAAAPDSTLQRHASALAKAGQPVIRLALDGPAELAAVMLWQVAVAVCAAIIGVNPFDEPDADALQSVLRKRLADSATIQLAPGLSPATGARRLQLADASAAPRSIQIAAYFSMGSRERQALAELRQTFLERGIATAVLQPWRDGTFATQQGHAGRADALVLALHGQLSGKVEPKLAPLAQLASARMVVDLRAWEAAGRRLVHVDLGPDPQAGLCDLRRALSPYDDDEIN